MEIALSVLMKNVKAVIIQKEKNIANLVIMIGIHLMKKNVLNAQMKNV